MPTNPDLHLNLQNSQPNGNLSKTVGGYFFILLSIVTFPMATTPLMAIVIQLGIGVTGYYGDLGS